MTQDIQPYDVLECPRCYDGTDPRARPEQTCIVCWGEMKISLSEPSWPGQYRKTVEHLLLHPRFDEVREILRGTDAR